MVHFTALHRLFPGQVAAVSLVPKHAAVDKAKATREAAVAGLERAQAEFNVRAWCAVSACSRAHVALFRMIPLFFSPPPAHVTTNGNPSHPHPAPYTLLRSASMVLFWCCRGAVVVVLSWCCRADVQKVNGREGSMSPVSLGGLPSPNTQLTHALCLSVHLLTWLNGHFCACTPPIVYERERCG